MKLLSNSLSKFTYSTFSWKRFRQWLSQSFAKFSKWFNNLPLARRKLIAITIGLLIAIVCVRIITSALTGYSFLAIPESISTPVENQPIIQTNNNDSLIPVGRLESTRTNHSTYYMVAVNGEGELVISNLLNTSSSIKVSWNAATTAMLQAIEAHYRFIPVSTQTEKVLSPFQQ